MIARWIASLDAWLIEDWRKKALQLWSVRVAALWGAVFFVIMAWPALASVVPLWLWGPIGFAACVSFAVARFAKQPGTDING